MAIYKKKKIFFEKCLLWLHQFWLRILKRKCELHYLKTICKKLLYSRTEATLIKYRYNVNSMNN